MPNLKNYAVELTFERTAIIIIQAPDPGQAEKLARQVQLDDHPNKIGHIDGEYGACLCVGFANELTDTDITNLQKEIYEKTL